ncbi:MAG: ornithine--oxo-acid transaminase [Bacillota bacterium]|nr:ornithine--oxo-acid transaminase [Bacillota bacterium]
MPRTEEIIRQTEHFGARNYKPLPMVIAKAEGVWVWDPEGRKYMDMLSAYSALNHGHRHPRIVQALKDQADLCTLTSRAFNNDKLGIFYAKVAEITGKQKVLPMNTGAEAVETAIKAARRWAYRIKGVPADQAEIIVCEGNFHGRTTTIVSFSSDEAYRADYGPLTPGFRIIKYGDIGELRAAINERTAAFMVEPIQGEAGIRIPPAGFVQEAYELCRRNNVLFLADEIQTGLGRTGKMFCCDWEGVVPEMYIIGKALGGGVYPVSVVAADDDILGVFEPGSHGSTFGGNPMAAAVGIASIEVLQQENLAERSLRLGEVFLSRLRASVRNPHIVELRGRGLFVGVELDTAARPYCERLMREGVLAKETHENVIRFAPPLVITEEELEWALERIVRVLSAGAQTAMAEGASG